VKITRITVWAVDLPMARPYSLAGGRSHYDRLDSTIVRLDTDEGVVGWGEGARGARPTRQRSRWA